MAKNKFILPKHIVGKPYYVYVHVNALTNEPFYIGVGTCQKKSKYARSLSFSGRNNFWKNTVNKYGYNIVIYSESENYQEILTQEQNYIALLGLRNAGGCLVNITLGGEGCLGYKHTQEHINKLKEKYSGHNNPMYGKKLSKETKYKKALRMRGSNNHRFGRVGAQNPRSKTVLQLDPKDKSVINSFESIKLAARFFNISAPSINKALKNNTKSANYYWKYGN